MALFKTLAAPDRTQTQFAHKLKYWPMAKLQASHKELLRYERKLLLRKREIEERMHEDGNVLSYGPNTFNVVWAYNNMPTEQEWSSKSDDFLIFVELRRSPAIDCFAVAILSFDLPPHYGTLTVPLSTI